MYLFKAHYPGNAVFPHFFEIKKFGVVCKHCCSFPCSILSVWEFNDTGCSLMVDVLFHAPETLNESVKASEEKNHFSKWFPLEHISERYCHDYKYIIHRNSSQSFITARLSLQCIRNTRMYKIKCPECHFLNSNKCILTISVFKINSWWL